MASRKPHRKSRNGCLQCKQRRVKCDEQRPCCENCARRQKKCSLRETTEVAAEGSASQPRSQAQDGPCLLPTGRKFSQATRLAELNLMHHFATTTCETLGASPRQVELWKTVIPKEAMRHVFLMEGLLSIAALHRAHLEPSMAWTYTQAAIQYQNSGLMGYQAALSHINENNYEAIFVFSVMLTVLGFAVPAAYTERQPVSPAETIISIYELLKGVSLTMELYKDSIRGGMLKPLFQNLDLSVSSPYIMPQGEVEVAMARLRRRADFMTKYVGTEMRDVYHSGIDSLETSFRAVGASQAISVVVAWPVQVSHELVNLYKQGDPMALLLFVHYGVLALRLHDQWWGKSFGVRLIEDLSSTLHKLDPEWTSWTEWARRCALFAARLESTTKNEGLEQCPSYVNPL